MTKDDIFRDDVERSQRLRSTGRRAGRFRRKSTYGLMFIGFIVLLVVSAPSIVCQSPIGRSLIQSALAGYGFDGGVESLRVGWVTPLRIDGIDLTGTAAGTHITVDRVETEITLLQCIRGLTDIGAVSIRGVNAEVTVFDGKTSAEDDLAALLTPSDDPSTESSASNSAPMRGKIELQDVSARITDSVTGAQWVAAQSQAELILAADKLDASFTAVITDSVDGSGEIQGRIQYPNNADQAYQLDLITQRVPLSIASLVKRRLGEAGAGIPIQITGDTTGSMSVIGGVGSAMTISLNPVEFRNFVASDPSLGERIWRNGLTAISGSATLEGERIVGRKLQLTTDFGSATFDGAFKTSMSLSGETSPAAWLEALDGAAGAEIDLVAFEKALPGLIPLRDQAEISSGRVSAEITSSAEGGRARRSQWSLKTQAIRANASGRSVVIEPLTLLASIQVAGGQLSADTIRLESSFANANVDGNLQRGRIKGDIQFSRLSSMIQPLLEMPELSLAGQATCEMSWAAETGDQWRLSGNTNATDLLIILPGGVSFQQPTFRGEIDATGRWLRGTLEELRSLSLTASTNSLEATAKLVAPVALPSSTTPLPLNITSRGRLESLADILGPWMPTSLHTLQGGYAADATAVLTLASGEVTRVNMQIEEPRVGYGEQLYAQPQLAVDFDGRYAWPDGILDARKLTIVGDAISAAGQGTMTPTTMDLEFAWRAKLERLQGAVRPSVARVPSGIQAAVLTDASPVAPTRPVALRPDSVADASAYQVQGDCEGRIKVMLTADSPMLFVELKSTGNNVAVVTPSLVTAYGNSPQVSPKSAEPLWSERLVNLDANIQYDMNDGKVVAEKLQLATDWLATSLGGKAIWNEQIGDVVMQGSAKIKMPEVAIQLTKLLGLTVRLEGVHETPIEIVAARQGTGPVSLDVNANIGWESGEVAGIAFGSTSIPVEMNETTVSIQPAAIPVVQGRLQVAGDLHYSPGPMWMTVRPGVVAENLTMTPELTNRWLQYLAPIVANSTRIQGRFGVELAEAMVNLDNPMASRVRGNLRVQEVNLDSGPVANQLIGSIKQIQQLIRGANPADVQQKEKRLVTIPSQAIDFEFAQGVITHQRMSIEIDRAKIITSGQVHVDGRLNLVAQVPLDPSWLGSDLKGLAGQPITLPIDGTLSQPSLDSAGIRNLVGQLGAKALQGTAENYLEKQLGRGLEKLLGR